MQTADNIQQIANFIRPTLFSLIWRQKLKYFSSLNIFKVKFRGEEAEDAGGVTKEFFLLLLRDILDPKYGMFKVYEETHTIW